MSLELGRGDDEVERANEQSLFWCGGRDRVRLWPATSTGHIETVELSANDISRLRSKNMVGDTLTAKLAR